MFRMCTRTSRFSHLAIGKPFTRISWMDVWSTLEKRANDAFKRKPTVLKCLFVSLRVCRYVWVYAASVGWDSAGLCILQILGGLGFRIMDDWWLYKCHRGDCNFCCCRSTSFSDMRCCCCCCLDRTTQNWGSEKSGRLPNCGRWLKNSGTRIRKTESSNNGAWATLTPTIGPVPRTWWASRTRVYVAVVQS